MSNQAISDMEKRQAKRLLAESLFVVIEDQVNLNFATLDYNAFGMAILTDLDFQIGDEIMITIGSDDGFLIPDVSVTVRNKMILSASNEYRYGLQFNYDDRLTTDIVTKLKKLENILSM